MTPEQQQALAIARARARAAKAEQPQPRRDDGASWGGFRSWADGVLQGTGDEISAAAAATKESLFGGGLPWSDAYSQALDMYRDAREDYRQENPGTATAAEIGGSLTSAVPLSVALGPAAANTAARRLGQNALAGAGWGGLYGFNAGAGGAGERLQSAAASGAMGAATGAAIPAIAGASGRALQPVRSKLSPEGARLADVARQEGIPLSTAQATGSKPLAVMESAFGNMPMTAGPQQAFSEAQRQAFNRAVLRRAGVEADTATPEVIDRAFQEIGRRFDDVAARTTVNIDDAFYQQIDDVAQEYGRRLPTDVAPVFQSYIDDIAKMRAAGSEPGVTATTIDGKSFQKVYSDLRRRARSAKNRPDLQQALNALADTLDDAMMRTGRNADNLPALPGQQGMATNPADEWAALRRQYRNLLAVDGAMDKTTAGAATGDIMPTALAQSVRRQGGYTRGRGDLNDLARVGATFVRDNVPDSGTAQRMLMQNLLTGGVAGGAGYMGSGDPMAGLAFAGAGLAGPRLAQALYNSPAGKRYLGSNVLDRMTQEQIRRELAKALAAGSGAAGGQTVAP